MGKIKGSKAHALVVQEGSSDQNQRSKHKDKGKEHANPKKEGYSKPFNVSSGSKGGKGRNALTANGDSIQNPHACSNR
jgi:hypothetical protein